MQFADWTDVQFVVVVPELNCLMENLAVALEDHRHEAEDVRSTLMIDATSAATEDIMPEVRNR